MATSKEKTVVKVDPKPAVEAETETIVEAKTIETDVDKAEPAAADIATIIAQKQADYDKAVAGLRAKVTHYNDQKAQNKPIKEMASIMEDVEKLAKEAAGAAKGLAYAKLQGDPDGIMIAACRVGEYDAVKVKEDKVDPDSSETILKVEDTTRKFDLGDVHKRFNGIGADHKWIHAVEKLNCEMTAARAKELGCSDDRLTKIRDSFRMGQIARELSLGKNPVSNTNIMKTITSIVTMMLGEEYGKKALKHDLRYLQFVFTKADSKNLLKVKCANNKQMRTYMLSICHRIVTNGTYDVDYQVQKAK